MNQLAEQERTNWLIAMLWKAHLEKESDPDLPPVLDATMIAKRLFPDMAARPIYQILRRLEGFKYFKEVVKASEDQWAVILSRKGQAEGEYQWPKYGHRERPESKQA